MTESQSNNKDNEINFYTWAWNQADSVIAQYSGTGARNAFEVGARDRMKGKHHNIYTRSDCQRAYHSGYTAMNRTLREGTTVICDHCGKATKESPPVGSETLNDPSKKEIIIVGILRNYWDKDEDHSYYRGLIKDLEDKNGIEIKDILSEITQKFDGYEIEISIKIKDEHPNAKGFIWKWIKDQTYARVKRIGKQPSDEDTQEKK